MNSGWALLSGKDPLGNIAESGMLPSLALEDFSAQAIGDWSVQVNLLFWQLRQRKEATKQAIFVFERYHTRGGSASKNNEVVNVLIGLMIAISATNGYKLGGLVLPAHWKTHYSHLGVDWQKQLYPEGANVHIRDAAALGAWYRTRHLGVDTIQARLSRM